MSPQLSLGTTGDFLCLENIPYLHIILGNVTNYILLSHYKLVTNSLELEDNL